MKNIFNSKEGIALLTSVLILGFVFGFDDGSKTFIFQDWLRNFFIVAFFVAFSLLAHVLAVKYFAYRHNCSSEYRIWYITRFGFRKWERFDRSPTGKALKGVPLGAFLAVILVFLTNGLLYFTAIFDNEITANKTHRVGRKYAELTEYEEAIIQLSGPLANIALMVLGIAAGSLFKLDFGMFVTINFFIALFCMLPFSSLAGAKIFFGSRNLYVFGLMLIILSYILKGIGLIGAIILTIVLAALLTGAYYFLWEN